MRYISLLAALLIAISSSGQISKHFIWGDLGLGGYHDDTYTRVTDSQGGVSIYTGITYGMYRLDDSLYRPHNICNLKFRFANYFQTVHESTLLNHYDLGLMIGKSVGRVLQLNISGGMGVLGGKYETMILPDTPASGPPRYVVEKFFAFNVPLEMTISVVPFKGFGLGFGGFLNLNSEKSINGFVFKIELGKRR
jgi:hypothetical protein